MARNKVIPVHHNIDSSRFHQAGAARHGHLWLRANEIATRKLVELGISPSNPDYKSVIPLVVLHVLDAAKRHYSPSENTGAAGE